MPDMDRIREDHGHAQAAHETRTVRAIGNRYGTTSLRQGLRHGFWAGIEYALTYQAGIDNLTTEEFLAELRKGDGSLIFPIKSVDPSFWGVCPNCHSETLIDVDGCTSCQDPLTD